MLVFSDNLRQVDITSRDCLEIVNTVKRSYLASDYESPWQLKTAALVENRELEAVYRYFILCCYIEKDYNIGNRLLDMEAVSLTPPM